MKKYKSLIFFAIATLGLTWLVWSNSEVPMYYPLGFVFLLVVILIAIPTVMRMRRRDSADRHSKEKDSGHNNKKEGKHDNKGHGSGLNLETIGSLLGIIVLVIVVLWVGVKAYHSAFGSDGKGITTAIIGNTPVVRRTRAPQIVYQTCSDFGTEHQTCQPTGPAELDIPAGFEGMAVCWDTPWLPGENLQIHVMGGGWRPYKPNEEGLKVVGYRYTPIPGESGPKTYWLQAGGCMPSSATTAV